MISRHLLVISIVALFIAIKFVSYHKNAEKKLLHRFEHNINHSLCTLSLCLGLDTSCYMLDFRLDYKRHANMRLQTDYLSTFILMIKTLFNFWSVQPNENIFFGTLKLENGTVIDTVAKSPSHHYFEIFEQLVNISLIDTIVNTNQWHLLPYTEEVRRLILCSKDEKQSHSLLHRFFNSVNNNSNYQSRIETWTAAHLSVELLVMKILNGYKYIPHLYMTCGRVYFVENCGYTLQYHLKEMNLSNRLLVAKELLNLALELTDGTAHSNYSFYLTDLTADNIAIQIDPTSRSFLSLKVIDWGDVIIVNNDPMKTKDNFVIHVSENIDCGSGCLTFSEEEICKASSSDHNVFAVCKEFFSADGCLLHELIYRKTSKKEREEIRYFKSLVKHCLLLSEHEHLYKNRLDTAQLLISSIQQIFEQGLYNDKSDII
ncbi:Protein kinase-like domain,FAM69, protein-kinase domain [Cinara cedri]|uniref:Protein kinase-like domain,FAM69, protein-kinase domain n=1 Tax=Cinara cedri TaxID=506608 RepID=A0A5E4NLM2_9HEMI|nr:Protein kinase-like domain,FAM69, protein-kinase domain [Cinara cedri]